MTKITICESEQFIPEYSLDLFPVETVDAFLAAQSAAIAKATDPDNLSACEQAFLENMPQEMMFTWSVSFDTDRNDFEITVEKDGIARTVTHTIEDRRSADELAKEILYNQSHGYSGASCLMPLDLLEVHIQLSRFAGESAFQILGALDDEFAPAAPQQPVEDWVQIHHEQDSAESITVYFSALASQLKMEVSAPKQNKTVEGTMDVKNDANRAKNPATLMHALSQGEQFKLGMLHDNLSDKIYSPR